jgi:hypothetical protein
METTTAARVMGTLEGIRARCMAARVGDEAIVVGGERLAALKIHSSSSRRGPVA